MADETQQLSKDEIEAIRELLKNQLTKDDIKEIRDIIESEKRVKWLWSSIRFWSLWIAGVITVLTVGWDFFAKIIRAMVGK